MTDLDPWEVAVQLALAFERANVRYVLGGSLASIAAGEPRATLDVDLVADLRTDTVDAWLRTLGDDFTGDRAGSVTRSRAGARSSCCTSRR